MRTRVIELALGQDRAGAANLRTMATIGARGLAPALRPLTCLATRWGQIHAALVDPGEPGVSIVAFDSQRDRVAGGMWIAAKPGVINAGVVGRHGQCDLFLDGDAAMSLRHLLVIVEPARDWGGPGGADVRYRFIDLRTGTAFLDEAGRKLEAATALGPAFLVVGRYFLYCFPTGGDPWPIASHEAMAALPERVYVDERDAEPDRWNRKRAELAEGTGVADLPRPAHASVITAVNGPARARIDVGDSGEPRVGTLELSSRLGHDTIGVTDSAVRRGILLGRYSRCDTGGAQSLALERISRVHALVLEAEGRLWIVDAASTNGIAVGAQVVRLAPLTGGVPISLGGVGVLRWHPVV